MKLEDILLISDMDGTLLPSGGKLSETCKAEIAAFRELGGNFTLATGRSPMGVLPYLEELKLDGFVIVNNGAGIYDIGTKEMTWCQHLPPHFRGIVADIAVKFPRVALEVLDESDRHY
ncbi:MAG: HAD family hydrolase, partial [Sellimonas sp.]|nr:HAD family hydrolase [Sellimonas sp.]